MRKGSNESWSHGDIPAYSCALGSTLCRSPAIAVPNTYPYISLIHGRGDSRLTYTSPVPLNGHHARGSWRTRLVYSNQSGAALTRSPCQKISHPPTFASLGTTSAGTNIGAISLSTPER